MTNHPNRSKRHTPGPWSIGPSGKMIISGPRTDFAHGQVIASISAGPGKNTVANARLIAAAPDMLALLHRICDEVETPKQLVNAITDAEALIATIEPAV